MNSKIKAKYIYEFQAFKRGIGSKESLNIGDKRIRYEEKMSVYLNKIEDIAIRNGFIIDPNLGRDKSGDIYYDEASSSTDYTIKNWMKPPKVFQWDKRTPRVKIILRILNDDSWRNEISPKIQYLLLADPDHPIDEGGWPKIVWGDAFIEWTKDYKWKEEGII